MKKKSAESAVNISVIAPTCFYYQSSLFRELASNININLMVYFCSKEGLSSKDVHEMYKYDGDWGVSDEMTQGYDHQFLQNFSPAGSYLKWPFGLINFGIIWRIIFGRPDAVILMSWMNPTWWMAIITCFLFRIPFLYMTDANVQIEPLRSKRKRRIKHLVLGKLIFRICAGFLCAGTANRQLYQGYGVPDNKLFSFAYSWGYRQIIETSEHIKPDKISLRRELGIPVNNHVFLYCGRLSPEKNLMALINAYERVARADTSLIFVGDGAQKQAIQEYVQERRLDSIKLFGFQDRRNIYKFYAASDVLGLLSSRETWGIVVNEAMCFSLPIIVSQQVGAGIDLVTNGYNGYSVAADDITDLEGAMRKLIDMPENDRSSMGDNSLQLITAWCDRDLGKSLLQITKHIKGKTKHLPMEPT